MAMDAAPASDLTPGLGHERPSFHHSGDQDGGSHSSERQLRAHNSWRQAALGVGGVGPDLQSRVAVLPQDGSEEGKGRIVELGRARNLSKSTRELIVKKALATDEQDAERLLRKIRERQDKVGMQIPSVEVRFENLTIESSVYIGSRALPSVLNAYRNFFESGLQLVGLLKNQKRRFTMLDDISGVIHPGRLCLLLGPPGSGKTTLLRALAAKTGGLKVQGNITYNGHAFNEFFVPRTAAYIDQTDNHTAQLTVRETFDFSTRVQGVGNKAKDMEKLRRLEKEMGIEPDWDIDAYMKAQTLEGKRQSIQTEYILSILGLDVCADTLVGNQMIRGISGGTEEACLHR
ncbi:hypothetical protein WJX74_000632 [Apatococcus lobatus]|uniref:ABC transporter domain-containing protein n=1 Tax=Apatococcus lobatus TaxID=904363 RepID=A0AAW1QYL1_9CHLO